MKGDFSRDTYNVNKNFSSVLMQQGRLLLDADWNEQSSIVIHYLRTLAMDLIGQHGGPGEGFTIDLVRENNVVIDVSIAPGRYYVHGIPCETPPGLFNGMEVSYYNQPYYRNDAHLPDFPFMVYLDVWERHVTCFEDESLCEVALGGIDTTTRMQTVWQVKVRHLRPAIDQISCTIPPPRKSNVHLIAEIPSVASYDDPCNIEPDAKYGGMENQFYRVEIHRGNVDEHGLPIEKPDEPTFKWSRENGSVVFPIISLTDDNNNTVTVRLANLGRDDKFTLQKGDWVEIVDDNYTLQNLAEPLLQVSGIDRDEMLVTLDGKTDISADETSKNHPLLRRWDHKAGNPQEGGLTLIDDHAARVADGVGKWLKLEDGIQIQFRADNPGSTILRTGDYWLIPARIATGDIEWPTDEKGNALPQLPRGMQHHYAPLGIITVHGIDSCRCEIRPRCPISPQGQQVGGTSVTGAQEIVMETPVAMEKAVKPAAAKKAVKPKKQKTPK